MFKKPIMGVRPGDPLALVMATPSSNIIRLNSRACEKIGVNYSKVTGEGQYITSGIVSFNEQDRIAIVLVDGDSEDMECSKLGSPQRKASGSLQFASAGMYSALNGNRKDNTCWKVEEKIVIDKDGNVELYEEGKTLAASSSVGFLLNYYENRAAGTTVGKKLKKTDAEAPSDDSVEIISDVDFGDKEEEEEEIEI